MNIKNIVTRTILVFLPLFTFPQETAIMNTNMQIYASMNSKPVAWATTFVEIHMNKATGEFTAILLVDHLNLALTNPDFTENNGESRGKFLTLKGVIPVLDVLDNNNSKMNLNLDITANFNGIDYPALFSFSILRMKASNHKAFFVMSEGSFSISKLKIDNLKQFDDELKSG